MIKTYEKGRVERGLLHDPPNSAKLINAAYESGRPAPAHLEVHTPLGTYAKG